MYNLHSSMVRLEINVLHSSMVRLEINVDDFLKYHIHLIYIPVWLD